MKTAIKYFSFTAVLFLSCFFLPPLAHASTIYYFNNAVNTSPSTLGNYWLDSGLTTPATSLPDFSVDEVNIEGSATFNGDIIFNGSAINNGTVTGNAIFNDNTENDGDVSGTTIIFNANSDNSGTIEGTATFNDNSINNLTVNGATDLNDNADNEGTINGDATFYGDYSLQDNTVTGTQTRYFFTDNNINPVNGDDFSINNDGSPWIVVADGVIVDMLGRGYDATTTFTTLNGGSFVNKGVIVENSPAFVSTFGGKRE